MFLTNLPLSLFCEFNFMSKKYLKAFAKSEVSPTHIPSEMGFSLPKLQAVNRNLTILLEEISAPIFLNKQIAYYPLFAYMGEHAVYL